MIKLENYLIIKEVCRIETFKIFKAIKINENKEVIIKVSNHEKNILLENEYKICNKINKEYILKSNELKVVNDRTLLEMEAFKGKFLKNYKKENGLEIEKFLEIGILICNKLNELHNDFTHGFITPESIIVDEHSGVVKFTNLFQTSFVNEHRDNNIFLSEYFTYISPEQTGKVNMTIDYRTDFYSLGVIFYELLTGKTPFNNQDKSKVIYSHIAKTPTNPQYINNKIPKAVSKIVMKLLSKNPDNRYKSAYSIKLDLEECHKSLKEFGYIIDCKIPVRDISKKLNISKKIYGRKNEFYKLYNIFNSAKNGNKEIVLMYGETGIGKKRIFNRFKKYVLKNDVYFIEVKSNTVKSEITLNAVINIIKQFVFFALTDTDININLFKREILNVVNNKGKILIDIIPEVELIIGPQPELEEHEYNDGGEMIKKVFLKFIEVFNLIKKCITISLGDIVLIDNESLTLISETLENSHIKYIMLLGILKHRNTASKKEEYLLKESYKSISNKIMKDDTHFIEIKGYNLDDLINLIMDTFKCDYYNSKKLSEIIFDKTHGNPYIVNELIKKLVKNNVIYFDEKLWNWKWNLETVESFFIDKSVQSLLIDKLNNLPKETIHILRYAACIGNEFNLDMLSHVTEIDTEKLKENIEIALREQIIEIKNKDNLFKSNIFTYSYIKHPEVYEFKYESVVKSIDNQTNQDIKKEVNYKLVKYIINKLDDNFNYDQIAANAYHLNKFSEKIENKEQRKKIAKVYFFLGQRAKMTNNVTDAGKFFSKAIDMIDNEMWKENFHMTFELYKSKIHYEYKIGNYNKAEEIMNDILNYINDYKYILKLYSIALTAYIYIENFEKALEIGIRGLNKIGINANFIFDNDASGTFFSKYISEIKDSLFLKNNIIFDCNRNNSIYQSEIVDFLRKFCTVVYFYDKRYFMKSLVFMNNYLENLPSKRFQALKDMNYAIINCLFFQEYDRGYEYSISANEKSNYMSEVDKMYVNTAMPAYVFYWNIHLDNCLEDLEQGYKKAVEYGRPFEILYSEVWIGIMSYIRGKNLIELESKVVEYIKENEACIVNGPNVLLNVLKRNIVKLTQDNYLEEATIDSISNNEYNSNNSKLVKLILDIISHVMFKNFKDVRQYMSEVEKIMYKQFNGVIEYEYYFFKGISLYYLYENFEKKVKENYSKEMKPLLKKFKKVSEQCEVNFKHKYLILLAQDERFKGNKIKACELFILAIENAKENDYLNIEAIANELLGEVYYEMCNIKQGNKYILRAIYCYNKWGAFGKVRDLEEKYDLNNIAVKEVAATHIENTVLDYFNLNSVIKALQALSSEIDINNILMKLVEILIENAVAERVVIIEEYKSKLRIEAEGVKDDSIKLLDSILIDNYDDLPKSVINYVWRTNKKVVINNAYSEGKFAFDPYIRNKRAKSILCYPIVQKEQFSGLIYIENNITPNTFTEKKLETVELISTQAAIAIKNAYMYDKVKNINMRLEHQVSERTDELNNTIIQLKHEIAERKQTEEQLSISREKYRKFFELSPEYIYLYDLDKNEVVEANPALMDKFGMSLNEIDNVKEIDENVRQYNLNNQDESMDNVVKDILRGETVQDSKMLLKDKNQKDTYIEATYIPISSDDRIDKMICLARDITRDIEMEKVKEREQEKARLLEKAIEYDKLKTEFFANLSHELRTPLNVILGSLQIFNILPKEAINEKYDKKINKYLNIMRQNCYRLLRLVNNLIDITKIEDGYYKINLKNYNIISIVEDVSLSVVEYAEQKGINLVFDTEIEEKVMACDEEKIERIILNLLSNAIKFTDRGGNISVNIYDKNSHIIISIKDDGIGIPEEKQKLIFERFVQVDKSLSRNHEGSGIGLSLVKSLVELHGGIMELKSEPMKGSEFIIKLPVRIAKEQKVIINENENKESNYVEKIKIEFSDIYF